MTTALKINLHTETWTFARPFRITGRSITEKQHVVLELSDGEYTGRGEAWCIPYCGETIEQVLADIESIASDIQKGITRDALQQLLPRGGARNAVDLALWDLACKQEQCTIWQLTGIKPQPITTGYTIGIEDTPAELAVLARQASQYPLLKIKLDGDRPLERMTAIRQARPDARLIIDANQGWDINLLQTLVPQLQGLGVEMIEQPLPRGKDDALADYDSPIPLCADESCLDRSDLDKVMGRYSMINIKLDKTGGLTEALLLAEAAKAKGLDLMVGNMGGTSLCIAPATVVGQLCSLCDLDGPLLLKYDRSHAVDYRDEWIEVIDKRLWG